MLNRNAVIRKRSSTSGMPASGVLTGLWQDVRHAVRRSIKERGLTAITIITLAVCFGGSIATFAVVDGVILRPLPFPDADRLVAIYNQYPGVGAEIAPNSPADFHDRRKLAALSELATYQRTGLTVGGDRGDAERVIGLATTPSLFALLDTRPSRGRLLLDGDAEVGNDQKVVVTDAYWQRAFGRRDDVIGATLRVNDLPYTVVGVLPSDWRFIDPEVELVIPAAFSAQAIAPRTRHRNNNWQQVGRLATGVTLQVLQDQVDALNAAHLEEFPEMRETLADVGFATRAAPFQEFLAGQVAPTLWMLWAGAVVVLVIGAVNLGNIALVGALARRREWATRVALGAPAGRLLRQSLIDAWLLTSIGAAIGLVLASWLLTLARVLGIGLAELPRGTEIAVDTRVIIYAVVTAVVVGTTLGLLSLVARPRQLVPALQAEGRTGSSSRTGRTARRVLASAQVACALLLLSTGAAFMASLQRVLAVDVGFRTERLLTAQLNLPAARYATAADVQAFVDRWLMRVRQLPGVEAAGLASTTPFSGVTRDSVMLAEGYQMAPNESVISVHQVSVTDGYFEAIGARLVAGRWLERSDEEGGPRVIVIDDRLARKFFPNGDAVGKRMWQLQGNDLTPPAQTEMLTIVGVAAEMRVTAVVDEIGTRFNGACYYPLSQRPSRLAGLALRTRGEPTQVVTAVRQTLSELDPQLPMYDVQPVDELIRRSLTDRRTPALLGIAFAAIALLLASLGLHSVLAHQVSQRRRELGIRMALGASAGQVFRLVLWEGAAIVGIGALAGLAGTMLLSRLINAYLLGPAVTAPWLLVTVGGILMLTSFAAIAVPAWTAARTDAAGAISST